MLTKIWQHQTFRQFIKFCLVGLINTLIDFLVYLFLSRIIGLPFWGANLISVFIAMSSSFIFNKYWTFKNRDNNHKIQFIKFTLVNIVYFLLNNGIVFGLVHFAHIDDLAAKLVAVAVGMFWNFGANKLWTFR
ncbi:MAG: GtrA family protein [Candidatus Parcubacteria bacterium]|nr:GtrA family protein [Candidatus Parcubacteria bacterium]